MLKEPVKKGRDLCILMQFMKFKWVDMAILEQKSLI